MTSYNRRASVAPIYNERNFPSAESEVVFDDTPTTGSGNAVTSQGIKSAIDVGLANLVDSAPSTMNTLNELAASLNDDSNAFTTLSNSIGTKQDTLTFGISDTNVVKCGANIVDDDFLRVNGTTLEGRSASEVLGDIGGQASLTFGISDTNVVKCGSGILDDDFLRVNGTTLEGRSAGEVLSDIGGQASLTFGISDTNVVKCGSGIADDDFLRVNGTTLEGRSASEVTLLPVSK